MTVHWRYKAIAQGREWFVVGCKVCKDEDEARSYAGRLLSNGYAVCLSIP